MRQRKRTTHVASGLLLTAVAALSAQACTSSPASTAATQNTAGNSSSGASGAASPELTLGSAQAAFDAYVATSDQAAQAGNRTLALSVLTGVAYDVAHTQYDLARQSGVLPPYTRYSYGTPTFYLPTPAPAGEPQFFVANVMRTPVPGTTALTSSSEDVAAGVQLPSAGQVLMLFEKPAGHSLWQLSSVSQLAPGGSVPALATDSHGYVITEKFSVPSSTALVRPGVAPALQATVVDDGPASAASQVVASGPFTTGMYTTAVTSARGIATPTGDVHEWLLEGASYSRLALRTADGGVFILYAMYYDNIVETRSALNQDIPILPGPPIAVPDYVKPLLSPSRWTPTIKLQTQDVLSFAAVDPPAATAGKGDNGAKIQVIGIGGGLYVAMAK